MTKSLRLASVVLLALSITGPALAQVPSFQEPPAQFNTYSVAGVLTVPQTGAGDVFCVTGYVSTANHPAGILRIKNIRISGIDSTAQSATFEILKRSTANSGGTSTGSPAIVPSDSTNPASNATFKAYTAIPTPGTSLGAVAAFVMALADGVTVLAGAGSTWEWNPQLLQQEIVLRGVAQSACLNAPNAFTTAGPSLSYQVQWTEQ